MFDSACGVENESNATTILYLSTTVKAKCPDNTKTKIQRLEAKKPRKS